MATNPKVFNPPRRAMPGVPIPKNVDRTVEERGFHLNKVGADSFDGVLKGCSGGTITGAISISATDAVNNTVLRLMTFEHILSSGVPASGFGTEHFWQAKDTLGASIPLSRQQVMVTSPTAGAVSSNMAWSLSYLGTETEVVRMRPVGMLPTAGTSITGFTGGQFWARGDFFHSGTGLGFYNTTPATQPAGNSDILASLVVLGLRASSSNPPIDIGTGTVGCGKFVAIGVAGGTTGVFTAATGQTCLNLNPDTGDTIFVQPKTGTLFSQFSISGSYQWGTDPSQTNTNLFHIKNTVTGRDVFTSDNGDLVTLGANNAFATGVLLGGASSKIGFYGLATPIAKPTVTGSRGANAALASLMTTLANLGLVTDSTT